MMREEGDHNEERDLPQPQDKKKMTRESVTWKKDECTFIVSL